MTEYCIAPTTKGICGKKLPCKPHPTQSKYKDPDNTICLVVRSGSGAPGVCGRESCEKHQPDLIPDNIETPELPELPEPLKPSKRSRSQKILRDSAEPPKKKRRILVSSKDPPNSKKSNHSNHSNHSKHSKHTKKSKHSKHSHESSDSGSGSESESKSLDSVSLSHSNDALDRYEKIELAQRSLLKLQLDQNKKMLRLIRSKNNLSSSSDSESSSF